MMIAIVQDYKSEKFYLLIKCFTQCSYLNLKLVLLERLLIASAVEILRMVSLEHIRRQNVSVYLKRSTCVETRR